MSIKRGEFQIQSFSPDYLFTGEFGNGAPLPDPESYGGWSVTPIPKRMGLTEWAGRTPMLIPIEFLVDRLEEGNTAYVESQRDILEKIAATASRDDEPPVCIIQSGGLMPHDFTHAPHVRWVVDTITWDKDLTVNSAASRRPLRVGGVVNMRQYNHDDVIDSYEGPAARNRNKNSTKNTSGKGRTHHKSTHEVKAGETLTRIANDELGDSKRWKEIADLNNIRNPRSIKVGDVLRLPK